MAEGVEAVDRGPLVEDVVEELLEAVLPLEVDEQVAEQAGDGLELGGERPRVLDDRQRALQRRAAVSGIVNIVLLLGAAIAMAAARYA